MRLPGVGSNGGIVLWRKCYQGNVRACCCVAAGAMGCDPHSCISLTANSAVGGWIWLECGAVLVAAQGLEASGAAITTWPTTEERRLRGLTAPWVGFLVLVLASLGCWS